MSEENATTDQHGHEGLFVGLHSHDGGATHWHDEFGEHLAEGLSEEEAAARRLDWRMHNVQLVTVGIDIGSSTTHLMFSKIYIQLVGEGQQVQSVVVGREILWESPIILTPYLDTETIDAEALRNFVAEAYAAVGATANEIDTGSIILTGEALKRKNAHALAQIVADDAGKFVRASAGHHMEAVLAANGSGTVARSRRDGRTLLNVDVGGGSTKLALVADGEIIGTAAIAIGARLIVRDNDRRLVRIDDPARRVAESLGIRLQLGEVLTADNERRIVEAWTDTLADLIEGRPLSEMAADLMLTEPILADIAPEAIVFSGGVSEFLFFREDRDFGDLGQALARALRAALAGDQISLPAIIDPNLGIRATAVGASLFTVQVGFNFYLKGESMLPLHNVPVLVPRIEIYGDIEAEDVAAAIHDAAIRSDIEEGAGPVAIAVHWLDEVTPLLVSTVAAGIVAALPRTIEGHVPFVLLVDEAAAIALGHALAEEIMVPGSFIALEGVAVSEFAFVDVSEVIHPSEVVPVTVKSLLFAGGLDRRSVKQALLAAAKVVKPGGD